MTAATGTAAEVSGPATPPARLHLRYVDGLRGLAALYVAIGHAQEYPLHFGGGHGWLRRLVPLLNYNHLAVGLFICISGFCLMLPVLRHDESFRGGWSDFFVRRARRILPPYYITLAISFVLARALSEHELRPTWTALAQHVFLLQDFLHPDAINPVLWSIATECQIYLLFPLLVLCWRRRGPFASAAVALATSLVAVAAIAVSLPSVLDAAPQYLGLFAFGMLAAGVCASDRPAFVRARAYRRWMPIVVAGSVLLVLGIAVVGHSLYSRTEPASDYWWGLVCAALLIGMYPLDARREQRASYRLLVSRPLQFLGVMAYSVYLMHVPVLEIFWKYVVRPLHVGEGWGLLIMELGALPIAIAVTAVFFRVAELPFMRSRARTHVSPLVDPASAAVVELV